MPSGHIERTWKGELCGVYEIASYAQVTKAQVTHWNKEDWFPKPLDELRMGRVWNYAVVVAALKEKGYPRELDASGKKIARRKYVLSSPVIPE